MNILAGIQRLKKSLATETDPDYILSTKAILTGMTNFYFGRKTAEAKEIFEKYCLNCPHNVEDHVESMQINDKEIPAASKRMCSDCGGCTLSFKIRQKIKPCHRWK